MLSEKITVSERDTTIQRLMVVVDEMHSIAEIWATPCNCHEFFNG